MSEFGNEDASAAGSTAVAGLSTGDLTTAPPAGVSLLSGNSLGGAGQAVPEPSTLCLIGIAGLALLAIRLRLSSESEPSSGMVSE